MESAAAPPVVVRDSQGQIVEVLLPDNLSGGQRQNHVQPLDTVLIEREFGRRRRFGLCKIGSWAIDARSLFVGIDCSPFGPSSSLPADDVPGAPKFLAVVHSVSFEHRI